MATEKLEISLLEKLREINTRKNEIIINTGQLHLDINQLNKLISNAESEFEDINRQLNSLLSDLEKKYPKGEIDLTEGVIIF